MSETEKITETHLLDRIRREILPLFEQAIVDDSVIFENPYLKECWTEKGCGKKECPSFKKNHERCWQKAGTYCGGRVQGSFAEKYSSCSLCEVFKNACPTIVEELGEHLNNMLYLLRKQKFRTLEDIKKIEYLNRELTASLESLDSKNREIQMMVITDKLTGLYNRHYLFTVLEDEVARSSRGRYHFSVLLLDVDNFKSFNDTYGHLEGDKVLSAMGNLLKECLRKTDRAFRYGGEEFVVVLPDTDQTISYIIAERIRKGFREMKFTVTTDSGKPLSESRTVSVGLAAYQSDLDALALLARADHAMYQAKSMGKDMVIRYEEERRQGTP